MTKRSQPVRFRRGIQTGLQSLMVLVASFLWISLAFIRVAKAEKSQFLQVQSTAVGCLGEESLSAKVEEIRRGRSVPPALRVMVQESDGESGSKEVRLRFLRGKQIVAERHFSQAEPHCPHLQEAVSLLVALGIEELSAHHQEKAGAPEKKDRETESASLPPQELAPAEAKETEQGAAMRELDRDTAAPERQEGVISLFFGAGASGILGSGVAPVLDGRIGYEFSHTTPWRGAIRVGAQRTWFKRGELSETSGETVSAELIAGRGEGCLFGPGGTEACLGLLAGSVRAHSTGLGIDGQGAGAWVGASLGLGVSVTVWEQFFLRAGAELLLAMLRPRLVVTDSSGDIELTRELPLLSAQGELGLGIRF